MAFGNYREEFPDYDPATLPAIPADWKDTSWHNDNSPSWDTGRKMIVHVDYADVSQREIPDGPRFCVINNDGAHNEDLLQSGDWEAVLAFVGKTARFYVVSDTWMQVDGCPFDTREAAEGAAKEANRGRSIPCYHVKTQQQMDAYEAIDEE